MGGQFTSLFNQGLNFGVDGIGMPIGCNDALLLQIIAKGGSAFQFGGEADPPHRAFAGGDPFFIFLFLGRVNIAGILRSTLPHGKIGAFQMAACNMGRAFFIFFHRFSNVADEF